MSVRVCVCVHVRHKDINILSLNRHCQVRKSYMLQRMPSKLSKDTKECIVNTGIHIHVDGSKFRDPQSSIKNHSQKLQISILIVPLQPADRVKGSDNIMEEWTRLRRLQSGTQKV